MNKNKNKDDISLSLSLSLTPDSNPKRENKESDSSEDFFEDVLQDILIENKISCTHTNKKTTTNENKNQKLSEKALIDKVLSKIDTKLITKKEIPPKNKPLEIKNTSYSNDIKKVKEDVYLLNSIVTSSSNSNMSSNQFIQFSNSISLNLERNISNSNSPTTSGWISAKKAKLKRENSSPIKKLTKIPVKRTLDFDKELEINNVEEENSFLNSTKKNPTKCDNFFFNQKESKQIKESEECKGIEESKEQKKEYKLFNILKLTPQKKKRKTVKTPKSEPKPNTILDIDIDSSSDEEKLTFFSSFKIILIFF